MDPILNSRMPAPERAAVVRRLRRQVSTGTYAPPVDLLVDRLVSIIIAERGVGRPTVHAGTTRPNGRV